MRPTSPRATRPRRARDDALSAARFEFAGTTSSTCRSTRTRRAISTTRRLPKESGKVAHFCSMCGPKFLLDEDHAGVARAGRGPGPGRRRRDPAGDGRQIGRVQGSGGEILRSDPECRLMRFLMRLSSALTLSPRPSPRCAGEGRSTVCYSTLTHRRAAGPIRPSPARRERGAQAGLREALLRAAGAGAPCKRAPWTGGEGMASIGIAGSRSAGAGCWRGG